MRAVLTIQIPADDLRGGRILAASTHHALIRTVCHQLLALRAEELDRHQGDVFERELARLELEQLRARLSFALDEEVRDETH